MKRDMELVRKIALWAEEQEHGFFGSNPNFDGYSKEQVAYHVYLMSQAGLVVAEEIRAISRKSPDAILMSLTWEGHEFAAASKDQKTWKSTLAKYGGQLTTVAYSLLMKALQREAEKMMGMG